MSGVSPLVNAMQNAALAHTELGEVLSRLQISEDEVLAPGIRTHE
jgi:hypothetical protein